MNWDEIKQNVRKIYGNAAVAEREPRSGCGCGSKKSNGNDRFREIGNAIGYTDSEMSEVPEGANLGLGCGNPTAMASLKEGETVLDLGSGAGFDVFLAANRVGPSGRAIGVDMTPEMIDKARDNARRTNRTNVEFRLGEIENLPVESGTVDVVISNCVINLAPDKKRVFQEVFRVLKPGGRMAISDIVLTAPMPVKIMESIAAYVGCIAGAMQKDEYLKLIEEVGFSEVSINSESSFGAMITQDPQACVIIEKLGMSMNEAQRLAQNVTSIRVQAVKA